MFIWSGCIRTDVKHLADRHGDGQGVQAQDLASCEKPAQGPRDGGGGGAGRVGVDGVVRWRGRQVGRRRLRELVNKKLHTVCRASGCFPICIVFID